MLVLAETRTERAVAFSLAIDRGFLSVRVLKSEFRLGAVLDLPGHALFQEAADFGKTRAVFQNVLNTVLNVGIENFLICWSSRRVERNRFVRCTRGVRLRLKRVLVYTKER